MAGYKGGPSNSQVVWLRESILRSDREDVSLCPKRGLVSFRRLCFSQLSRTAWGSG